MSLESEIPVNRNYRVVLRQEAKAVIEIAAESSADALEEAQMSAVISLCCDCARKVDIDAIAWEVDSEPEIIS